MYPFTNTLYNASSRQADPLIMIAKDIPYILLVMCLIPPLPPKTLDTSDKLSSFAILGSGKFEELLVWVHARLSAVRTSTLGKYIHAT